MKLFQLTAATLAMLCAVTEATFLNCYVSVVRNSQPPYEYVFGKNGDNISGDCFGAYFDSVIRVKSACSFKSTQVEAHKDFDQAIIRLKTVCADDGKSTREVNDKLQQRGFARRY